MTSSHPFTPLPANMRTTQGVRPFSKDRLMMTPRDEAAKAAMALLHVVQDEAPEIAMAGVAVLFAAWCRRLGLSGYEAHQLGQRLLVPQAFHQKGNVQAEVLRDFAGMRMLGDPRVEVN